MGANITIHHASVMVRGQSTLKGAEVMATDLRASLSLVIAALAAEGETQVHRLYHLDRGYEALDQKLARTPSIQASVPLPNSASPVTPHIGLSLYWAPTVPLTSPS